MRAGMDIRRYAYPARRRYICRINLKTLVHISPAPSPTPCPHSLKVDPPSESLLEPTVGPCKSASSQSSSRLGEAAGPGANASVVSLLFAAPSGSHASEPATSVAALRRFSRTRVQSALWTTRSGLGFQCQHVRDQRWGSQSRGRNEEEEGRTFA